MQGLDLGQIQNLAGMMQQQNKSLVEFKAGKMTYDGRMVKPERRKGIIRVISDPSGMKQFQYLDADTKNPIDSFYVFPGDAKFEKVKQSKDRVYILEFASTQQRHFYWMQESDKEKDSENATKLHNTLNGIATQPAATTAQASAGPTLVSQQQQPATRPAASSQQQQQVPQFNDFFNDPNLMQSLLSSMGQQQQQVRSPGLNQFVTSEAMLKLIDENPEMRQALIEQLPEGQQNEQGLRENITSPQLQQALASLTSAIQSDQISIILASLGLDQSVLNNSKDGIEALVNALIKKYSNK